jgi:hypothetical protein
MAVEILIPTKGQVDSQIEVLMNEHGAVPIYGVSWDRAESPTLTRTNDSLGMTANVGTDGTIVSNDFDTASIYREIHDVEDTLGNSFVRMPKFYSRKIKGENLRLFQVSKQRYPGFQPYWNQWDFTNKRELSCVDIGKYPASLSGASALESIAGEYPLVNTNIVNMRTYAQANNTGGLAGYQQFDIHTVDMIRTLMMIEFATLDIQTIMKGYSEGRYSADDKLTADTSPAGNSLVVSNTTGAYYVVGQAISVGTSLGGNQRFYGRTITAIDVDTPGAGSTTITFDGDAVALSTDDILYNSGWKSGFSRQIAASSGSLTSNSSGKYPCVWRGIENMFGNIHQLVDGVNITDLQAWVCKNAEDYASNVFASPYEVLNYVNHNANGYISEMGLDYDSPFAEFPVSISGGGADKYYADYYYQDTGQRTARFGGRWTYGSLVGFSYWSLLYSSSFADVSHGGRLVKKGV